MLQVHIFGSGPDGKGISITGSKKTPVSVIGIDLYNKSDKEKGPSFGLSTCHSNKGAFIEGGVALFGTELGSITISYDPAKNRFVGSIDVKAKFLPDGHALIAIELVREGGKRHLRFVNLPTIFDDIIKAVHIIDEIYKLSSQDGSPCGAIKLAFRSVYFLVQGPHYSKLFTAGNLRAHCT